MKRNSDLAKRFPAYYRHDLLNKRREQLGLSVREVWQQSGVKENSTRRVFLGEASNKHVFPIALFLSMDWKMIHDFDLPEDQFRRAVLNGGSRSGDGNRGR